MTPILGNAVCNLHNRNKSPFFSSHLCVLLSIFLAGTVALSGCSENQRGLGPGGPTTGVPIQPPLSPSSPPVVIASAVDPTTNMVYVVDSGSAQGAPNGTLFVVDGASNSIVSTLPGLSRPAAVAVDSGTDTVYIANADSNTVSVLSGISNAIVATVPVGLSPSAVAVDQATHMVYVGNAKDGTVSVIDGATNTMIAKIALGITGIDLIAVDPGLNRIFVGSNQGYAVGISVIEGASNTVGTTIYIRNAPQAIAVDSASHTLFAESNETTDAGVVSSSQVDVIDEATADYTGTISVPGFVDCAGFAFDPATSLLYAGNNGSSAIDVLNRYAVTASVPYSVAGAVVDSVSVNPSTDTVYAVYSTQSGASVSIQTINGETRATTGTLKLQ